MWLVCLVHALGRREWMQPLLPRLQSAFMSLLGERAEFAQECASRGLALVYDCSRSTSRQALVSDLLDTFTTGRKAATVDRTGGGAIGAGPAGIALSAAGDSAYKELCSFANEVG